MAEALRHTGEPLRAAEAGPSFWSGLFFWLRPAFAAAALAVLIAAVWIGVRWPRPAGAEELIAQAYTEQRTIDVRIRGAKYSPVRTDRGPTISNYDRPVRLQKADAVISENLLKNPGDPGWLQAKANADMLEGRFDDAVKRLQRAIDSKPDSPELLTDLGSAYFLRGRSNRPADIDKATPSFPKSLAQNSCNPANSPHWAVDYMCAIDSFGKALMKNPDDPVALFNRALALGDVFLYAPAVDDWQHYLRIDPQGDWSAEARERLTNVKHKVIQRENSLSEPMLTPEDIAEQMQTHSWRKRLTRGLKNISKWQRKSGCRKRFPALDTSRPEKLQRPLLH